MGCRISDFVLGGEWVTETVLGHRVEMVEARTRPSRWFPQGSPFVLYKVDGRFKGAVGSFEGARKCAERDLTEIPSFKEPT